MSTTMAGAVPACITREILEEHEACADQVELFARIFPDGGAVTPANIRRAAAARLDLDWFARTFLPEPAQRAYAEAVAAAQRTYMEATMPTARAYVEATVLTRRAHEEAARAEGRANRGAVRALRRAYDEAARVAWRAYQEAMAVALIEVLGLDPGSGRGDP